ncbi:uncharacterized protein PHACADRAFT_164266 [Phanerochaete carnosa HHB-10118-sp]|uniref:Uncharacterized protein n=1 Tax=Phanerochaete carnosa (strain HHB-10118-sp) TaxID=650164 RepID=K5VLS9_PHACS|nr:uncharacterized protein PHACADRAFT_164266 [Phanerochaete carnosa HHB-10118-sp]EKM52358.1 hypothetical protein PHACADRAFT_164266 [Phanerochaete carnosa HHB-10118-sp]
MSHRGHLVNLYDVGPCSSQEQREVEAGRVTVNGRSIAVNSDFARQVVFISQQLDVSERYVAGLLQETMAGNPNVTQERLIEATLLEFHLRRRHLADCLRYIFEAAEVAQDPSSPELFRQLELFTKQNLLESSKGFPQKLFKEVERLGETIAKVHAARLNAKSNTAAPLGQTGQLGYDLLTARYESLKYERRTLAITLFLVARMGCIQPQEVLLMIDWLEKNPHHAMVYYILPTLLACFDLVDPSSTGGQARQKLTQDANLLATMKRKLAGQGEWKEHGLQATLLMKWTLFSAETRNRDPSLEDKEGFKTEELETQVWNAVQGDSFVYLARIVAMLQRKQGDAPPTSFAGAALSMPEPEAMAELPTDDFKPVILESFEFLIRALITHASSELRKIKQRQEDILLANQRTDRTRMFRSTMGQTRHSGPPPGAEGSHAAPPRNDIAMLYSLIGLLYSALPAERALQFWGGGLAEGQRVVYLNHVESAVGKLPSFLQWAVWSTQIKDVDMLMALYDMLTGLSKGQHCSELAYNFLVRGGSEVSSSLPSSSGPAVSWSAIFGLLEQWAIAGATPRPAQPSGGANTQIQPVQLHRQPHQLILTQQDVLLAQSFLRLLSNVVTWSVAVRVTISGHARFRAIPTLVSLIPLSIPLELKGALLDTLSSFCAPGGGLPGVEVCRSVWTLMERLEVINVRVPPGTTGATLSSVKGIEMELEEVESVHKLYPETIPFLKLLSTLIHTPKSIPARERLAESEPLNTIPDSLGQPYRAPGIAPYVAFVIDNVFSRISQREYLRPTDRWRMNDLCLCFVERCLASFDLESLVSGPDDISTKGDLLLQLATHPGHDVMKRILTHSQLHNSIFSYIIDGLDGFDNGLSEEEPFFRHTITRTLRIVHRVLEIQDIFLDVFVPLLSSAEDISLIGPVHPVSYYIRLDQALMFTPEHVPAVAAYLSYPSYPEMSLLAIKILAALSTPSTVSQLAVIIDRSSDSLRILDGFRNILDTDSPLDVDEAEAIADEKTGAGALDLCDLEDSLDTALRQTLRLAVLEFFIQNTKSDRPYPNVAHFLLFGKATPEDQIQDPNALGSRRVSIHSLLEIVNSDVPRLKSKGKGSRVGRIASQALMTTLPAFSERCYLVLYQLCKHPRTSEFTMRYLRSREDFFARHLAALPFRVPVKLQEPYIEMQYNDGSRVVTTVPALCAFLRVRSIIFDLVALELHVLTNKGHLKASMELLELLYGSEEDLAGIEATNWEEDIFRPFHEIGQSHIPVIEFLQSLDFDWSDSLAADQVNLEFFGYLNLGACLRVDASGCEIVDRDALVSLLTTARRTLHAQGRVLTQTHLQQIDDEMTYVLESCATENHRRKVLHSTAGCYESWRRLLDMTLTKCFDRIPQDRREGLLFDLLHVLPTILRSPNISEATTGVLAEAILSTITKLREDKLLQSLVRTGEPSNSGTLPAERLFSLLRSLLDCIVETNRHELVRGNLYAAVVNYMHLIADTRPGGGTVLSSSLSKTQPAWMDDPLGGVGHHADSWMQPESASSLVNGSLSIFKPLMENLVSLVSRDAIDGTDVWKTVAFTLLDSLVRLSQAERQPAVITAMSRSGFTRGFISGVKGSDLQLQAVLKPDPDELNSLYVYEARMSLLIRMAQTRAGAERLLENRLVLVLADCDFVDSRPETDQAFLDRDSFLPSAIQRYHQLLVPALQVVTSVLATLGPKHSTAVGQGIEFLRAHRDTAILLLKSEAYELSLTTVEEMRLLVALCTSVLSAVPKTDVVSTSGYGGLHAAITGLAARTLGNCRLTEAIRPTTEEEAIEASLRAPAYGQSKFRLKVHTQEMFLRKALASYLGTASDFTEHDFTPVLSPIISASRQDESSTRFMATVPSLGDAIEALNYVQDDLSHALKQFSDCSAELASNDHALANVPEMLDIPDTLDYDSLSTAQRRALVENELCKWQNEARSRAQSLFQSMEMLLLLIWRHLAVYSSEGSAGVSGMQNFGASMRVASSFEPDTFRQDASRRLAPMVHRLTVLAEETLNFGWAQYQRYIDIMAQRLKDTAGLHDSPEQTDEESMER